MSDAHNEVKSILEEANKKMDKSIEAFKKELNTIVPTERIQRC
jgi:ribosome recycling factor